VPLIWSAISAHGYGHAAQVVPVLNELGKQIPSLRVILRTNVPRHFFESRMTVPWELRPSQMDIGCLQHGPLTMDWDATWQAHRMFHANWDARLKEETLAIRDARPDLVIGNTPYLAMAAGAAAGVPTVAIASLSWDDILREHLDPRQPWHTAILEDIRRAYGQAHLLLRLTPGLPMPAFRHAMDIGPIAHPLPPARTRIRQHLGIPNHDTLVLVAFGGIRFEALPFDRMESMPGIQFLIDGPVPPHNRRVHSLSTLSERFSTLLSSVDVIMTKPGYGTTLEAVATHVPVVYVRRYDFIEEDQIVAYLHRYGRGVELSRADFLEARWKPAIRQVLTLPTPASPPPACTGAADAAKILVTYLP
jgi:UDP:flavonoid glycosyltransferase YjiC (YdhE family)